MTGLQRKILRDYKTLRTQVLTIAVLVLCGVSVLVSSWSSYESLRSSKEDYYERFNFADVWADLVRSPDSNLAKLSQLEGVEQVESRIIKDGLVDVQGQSEPAVGHFISWGGEHQILNKIYLRQGRAPQLGSTIEVIVHEAFAEAHGLRAGDVLHINLSGQKRRVLISGIGLSPEYVYALSPLAALPDDKHFGVFWMRQGDLATLTGMTGSFNSVQVKVKKNTSMNELKRKIDVILQPFGSIRSYDRSQQLSNIFVEDEIRQQRVMAIVVPLIFLSVAMFILNIVLSRFIHLQRGQIATLKSLGYSAGALTLHYFQQVTLILLTGILPSILAGAGIGKWYASLYQDFFRFPNIDFSLSVTAIALGFLAGLLPGWIWVSGALYQVFNLFPAEALRPPNPPDFQKGLFEKLGLAHRMDLLSRMVWRSLLFRPFRTIFNVLGIASALAILIVGSFWTDIINAMINRQFHEMRREDVTINLLHPKKASVFSELSKMSGVLMMEGERHVPVRMQFKNFKKEILLLGMNSHSQLSHVFNQDGKIVRPIKDGVILSRFFETKYALRVGDLVEFKDLVGGQKTFEVPIAGFVDDMIGQQGYVLGSDLHKWLDEESVVDTVKIRIDPAFLEKLYVSLKEMPEVAGVNVRRLLLKSFTDTIAGMISTFTIILFIFAIAIAVAVIYNSARISFAERAWELASLRILGYGTLPTFELLFIDIGIQVLLAVVPGLSLGYWLSYLSTRFIHNDTFMFPLVIDFATYAIAVLVLILVFCIGGFVLYRNVSRLDFSKALKARE